MKMLKKLACILMAVLMLSACGAKKETPEEIAVHALDFDKVAAQTIESVTSMSTCSHIVDMSITLEDDTVNIAIVVDDAMKKELSLEYADTAIRQLGFYASIANNEIHSPGKDHYGTLYDVYDLSVAVSPLSKVEDYDDWYIHDYVCKGLHTQQPIELK